MAPISSWNFLGRSLVNFTRPSLFCKRQSHWPIYSFCDNLVPRERDCFYDWNNFLINTFSYWMIWQFFWPTFWGLTFEFDLVTGHISVWPFYRTHFILTFLPDTFEFDLFTVHISVRPFCRTHFSLTFLPDTFEFDLFTRHISVWPFYQTHFILTFLPDTFEFDLFTRHISVWPFYRTHFSLTFLPDTF